MSRPVLLDLFCKAGGATKGYQQAGFHVVGVDIEPQPRYCGDDFVQADAMTFPLEGFNAIHASPPCQDHTRAPSPRRHGTGWMLAATRDRLSSIDVPWVIENVPGAPMRADFVLCGCMFGLDVRRERWFETSWHGFAMNLSHDHRRPALSVVGNGTPSGVLKRGIVQTAATCRLAMDIPWMTRAELSQAIPPAYTQYVGNFLLPLAMVA